MAKQYIGISQDGHVLKIARVHRKKNKLVVTRLDRINIGQDKKLQRDKKREEQLVKEYSEDYAFGIDQHFSDDKKDMDDLKMLASVDNGFTKSESANDMLLVSYLEELKSRKVAAGTTIPAGRTDFQVLRLKDYSKLKKKEVAQVVNSKLSDLHDTILPDDRYVSRVEKDGSLVLASLNEESYTLQLINRAKKFYSGKIRIEQVLPDEAALLAMVKKNYLLKDGEITGVIQLGAESSRVFFMKGEDLFQVLPEIRVGSDSKDIMSIIFSKILFQLDTGELPNIDRFIIANNELKEKSINYLKEKFPAAKVGNFKYDQTKVVLDDDIKSVAHFFTTAIGAAWSAIEAEKAPFSDYSMTPDYIIESQKVLKFKWHGWVVMALIMITPVAFIWMYQQKQQQIEDLGFAVDLTQQQIQNLKPIADQVAQIYEMKEEERSKLATLATLNSEPYFWSTTLKTLNDGLGDLKNVWMSQLRTAGDGITVQGYTMTRNRAPRVTNMFKAAELKAVSVDEMRGTKLYKFVIKIHKNFDHSVDGKFQQVSLTSNK